MEIFRKKGEATVIAFPMVTTANPETFDTGLTVTDDAYFSDAGGAWSSLAISDTVAEIGTTGLYELSLNGTEMDHDNIIIKMTATGASDTAIVIRTRAVDEDDLVRATTPANTLDVDANGRVDVGAVLGTAQTAGDIMASLGEENATAAAGDPSTTENVMQYVKQLVNVLVGTAGVTTFPAEAAPANAVSLAEVIRAIHADVTGLNGEAMRGTDSAFLAANAPTNFSDLAITATTGQVTVGTNTDKTGYTASTVTDKTGYFISGTKTTLDALNDISTANVNTEVADVMKTDTSSTDGLAGAPPESASMEAMITYIYKCLRNKKDSTASLIQIYDDAGTTVDHKRTISDNGTTFTEEEIVSGP